MRHFSKQDNLLCPLCSCSDVSLMHQSRKDSGPEYREFFHCGICDLVFVPSRFLISYTAEKKRYTEHNNDLYDEKYRNFLRKLYTPLRPYLKPGSKGLDYGSGPGPALATMMKEDGFNINLYDPFFHPIEINLQTKYDFITCSETAEHFRAPKVEFDKLQGMLKPNGWLGIMTGMLEEWSQFPAWYYNRDPTHIRFYSRKTMTWISKLYSWDLIFPGPNVTLFYKLSATSDYHS